MNESLQKYLKQLEFDHLIRPVDRCAGGEWRCEDSADWWLHIPLDVATGDNAEKATEQWNREYYKRLPYHLPLYKAVGHPVGDRLKAVMGFTDEQLSGLGVGKTVWPDIDEACYRQLHQIFKRSYVLAQKVEEHSPKFVIVLNLPFWRQPVAAGQVDTLMQVYDEPVLDEEIFHHDLSQAVDFGIVMVNGLNRMFGVNPHEAVYKILNYHFELLSEPDRLGLIRDGVDPRQDVPVLDFLRKRPNETGMERYRRVLAQQAREVDFYRKLFARLPEPPFWVVERI